MKVELVWATPQAEEMLVRIARVSNPANERNMATGPKLIGYLIGHRHWSPFEMVHACIEVAGVSRAVTRQLLRHRSFSFQELSQRYTTTALLDERDMPTMRLAVISRKQSSRAAEDPDELARCEHWTRLGRDLAARCASVYAEALADGMAPESARMLLPEGYTASRLYMVGSLRSWVHYLDVRLDPSTQVEHRTVAERIEEALRPVFPMTLATFRTQREKRGAT